MSKEEEYADVVQCPFCDFIMELATKDYTKLVTANYRCPRCSYYSNVMASNTTEEAKKLATKQAAHGNTGVKEWPSKERPKGKKVRKKAKKG